MSRILRDANGKAVSGIMLENGETVLFDEFKKDKKRYDEVCEIHKKRILACIGYEEVKPVAENAV